MLLLKLALLLITWPMKLTRFLSLRINLLSVVKRLLKLYGSKLPRHNRLRISTRLWLLRFGKL
nr:MAG TPA: hypothetical protein [Caudoviricetes sp.]